MKKILRLTLFLMVLASPTYAQVESDEGISASFDEIMEDVRNPDFDEDPNAREINIFEFAYLHMAHNLLIPELCEKISPSAYHYDNYIQSECFYNIALKTKDPDYCSSVIRYQKEYLLGDENTVDEEICLRDVENNKRLGNFDGGDKDVVLRFMGYSPNFGDEIALYFEKKDTEDFRDRLDYLPDFSEGESPLEDYEEVWERVGCGEDDDYRWFCHMTNCLSYDDEDYQGACLEVSRLVKNIEYLNMGKKLQQFKLSQGMKKLFEEYPDLKEGLQAAYKGYSGKEFNGF